MNIFECMNEFLDLGFGCVFFLCFVLILNVFYFISSSLLSFWFNFSRSRSATPSSYPGTPPQTMSGNDLTGSLLASTSTQLQQQNRNYSDIMRSLAAKYNNNNPNE